MFPIGEEKPCCNSIGSLPTSLIFQTTALHGGSTGMGNTLIFQQVGVSTMKQRRRI
jgi:hypothetical protein